MFNPALDPGLENLLELDGVVLVVDENGGHWVKFVIKRVPPSNERPHGINYSLTLHSTIGERLVGYDNAHSIATGTGPSRRKLEIFDHRHRHAGTHPYLYKDAMTLLQDFWKDVDAVLHERGVIK